MMACHRGRGTRRTDGQLKEILIQRPHSNMSFRDMVFSALEHCLWSYSFRKYVVCMVWYSRRHCRHRRHRHRRRRHHRRRRRLRRPRLVKLKM